MIAIIDYGVGNLFSLIGSLTAIGQKCCITADPREILSADRVILPGVGAFGDAAARLATTGLIPLIKQVAAERPLLGICLGMQLLFDKSYEYGEHQGLGLIHGTVRAIADDLEEPLKVPHMGWNSLHITHPSPLFRYVSEGDAVYYVHSFYAVDCEESITATSQYGVTVTGAVQNGNVFGTQFHPEKSGQVGLSILRAFAEL